MNKLDGRTNFAKRIATKKESLLVEYSDNLSHKVKSLCDRIAYLEVSIEDRELVSQGNIDGGLVQAVNTLQGLYRQIESSEKQGA